MKNLGKITSFEPQMNVGIITSLSSGHAVTFLGGDVAAGGVPVQQLIGKRVAFDLIQTAKGAMAINIVPDSPFTLRPGEKLATLVTLPLLAGTSYYLYEYLQFSLLISYLGAVNLVAFLLLVCQSSRGVSYRTSPSEFLLALLALGGAAPSVFIGSALVPTKWRSDAGRFALFAMVIVQVLAIRAVEPRLMSKQFASYIYRSE